MVIKNKKIRVIHQGTKKGYGNAIREGLKNCRYDLSMHTDCDNPFDFILETAATYLKKAPAKEDVLSIFAGLRPLAAVEGGHGGACHCVCRHGVAGRLYTAVG